MDRMINGPYNHNLYGWWWFFESGELVCCYCLSSLDLSFCPWLLLKVSTLFWFLSLFWFDDWRSKMGSLSLQLDLSLCLSLHLVLLFILCDWFLSFAHGIPLGSSLFWSTIFFILFFLQDNICFFPLLLFAHGIGSSLPARLHLVLLFGPRNQLVSSTYEIWIWFFSTAYVFVMPMYCSYFRSFVWCYYFFVTSWTWKTSMSSLTGGVRMQNWIVFGVLFFLVLSFLLY